MSIVEAQVLDAVVAGEQLERLDVGKARLDRGDQRRADAAPLQPGVDAEAAHLADAIGHHAAHGSGEPTVHDRLQHDVPAICARTVSSVSTIGGIVQSS